MKKRKRPKLVVDNKLPEESDPEVFTYEEFKVIAENLLDMHARYPEIDVLTKRARDNKDEAMGMALFELSLRCDLWREVFAEKKRSKLRVVKRKRDL
jgi:hypothetical protein